MNLYHTLDNFPLDKGLIVFDGYCNLCNNVVNLLLKIDRKSKLLFTTFDSNTWKEISGVIPEGSDSIVFIWQGKHYIQSEAVIKILECLGNPWKMLGVFKILPARMRDGLYKWIARNRYRIFGRKDVCMIPDDSTRARFLD